LGSPEAAPILIGYLQNQEYQDVLGVIGETLGKCVDTSHIPALLECLQNQEDSGVRCTIIGILGKIGSSEVVPTLLGRLRSEEWNIRRSIADALGKIGFDALDAICVAWDDYEGEEAQEDLAQVLYTLATINSDGN
ncbi:HEAT repeat domain-containing protein, partial [Armatimonas sp.]|uniref:HEAT repeat domain-containing protein n=1 Tax=Armatimonas sp. TaxID=1872638 RepID=UPI00286BCBD2